jgi:Effector-associated domain 1
MSLSGLQRKQLKDAIIDAFPNNAKLEQMFFYELDKNLNTIAGEGCLEDIVFKIIQTAEVQGWMKDLINAAQNSNKNNLKLKNIAEELLLFVEIPINKVTGKEFATAVEVKSVCDKPFNQGDTISKNPKKQSIFNLQGAQFGGGLVNAETVNAYQIGGNITNYATEQKQNLAQIAAEIQQLLTQLEQTNPTMTSAQKMAVVAQAVEEIEKNPTLKARVVGALKSGGAEALKEALDHPLVNVFIAATEGWQDAE